MTYTSTITTTNIDEHYPIAGVDNNTDGFRNNFFAIKSALVEAANEISSISSRAVLTSGMTNPHNPVENDLAASKITNGTYKKFYSITYTPSVVAGSSILVDLEAGNLQKFLINLDVAITVSGWPASGQYASVRLHLKFSPDSESPTRTTAEITSIGGENNAAVYQEADYTPPHVSGNNEFVYDIWSYDGGDSIFIKYIGEFQMLT